MIHSYKNSGEAKKIGIDARFYGAKDKGFGRYVQQLIKNLEEIDKSNQYFVFLRKERENDYQPQKPNFKKVIINYPWYSWKEQILFPLKLKKYKLDLIHFTHFNLPIFYRGKFVVTIHDLTLRQFPTFKKNLRNFLFYPFKKIAYKLVFAQAVKKAEKVIAISNYTKKEILRYYKVNPDKIKVIYEGVHVGSRTSNILRRRSNFLKIKKPYLLYVGNAYPHKNLERLISAFKKLIENYNLDYQLVLVGGDDYFYKKLKKYIKHQASDIKQFIIFTGFVSDKELDVLYSNASLYVFPSLSEGFGLPPLEAMAHRLPVASSGAACLPEILGKAVIYFSPLDIDDMAEKIKKALLDSRARKKLVQAGLEQVKRYSWRKMAEEILKIYNTCFIPPS